MSVDMHCDLSRRHAYCLHSPVAKAWSLLSTDLPIEYKPTHSNTIMRLTLKNNDAQIVDQSAIYNLTVLGLADIANSTVATKGEEYLPRFDHENSTFTASCPPSNFQFMMTASDSLPVRTVTDVLRGIQELTHYLWFLELAFEVFGDKSPTSSPIASGCLAINCDSHTETVQPQYIELVDSSVANFSTAPSRQSSSPVTPTQLTTVNEIEALSIAYNDLNNPLPVPDQSFADVASRMLADITSLIIVNEGDGLLPLYGHGKQRLLRYVDTWGSNLAISLLPLDRLGRNFTLGQAAMALKATQNNFSSGSMVESRMEIMVDGSMVGWGCLSYANLSAWRCLMPSVQSREESSFPDGRRGADRRDRIYSRCRESGP